MSISTLFLDGDNKQLRDAIFKATPKAVEQCRILAQKFRGKDDMQTCQNIWNFLKNDVTYVVDGEHQKIKLPSALLRERVGDCKSYSLFTAGILGNLGIPFKYALTSYTNDPTPAHIYVKCDNGVIIDAVWTAFNQEKKPNHIYYQKPNMKISYIAGINAPVQKSRQSDIIGCSCDSRQPKSIGCCCNTKGVAGLGGMPCLSGTMADAAKDAFMRANAKGSSNQSSGSNNQNPIIYSIKVFQLNQLLNIQDGKITPLTIDKLNQFYKRYYNFAKLPYGNVQQGNIDRYILDISTYKKNAGVTAAKQPEFSAAKDPNAKNNNFMISADSQYPVSRLGAYRRPLGTTMNAQFAGIGRTGTDWAKAIGREQGTYDTLAYYTKAGTLFIPRQVILALIRNNGGGIANFLYNAWLRTERLYLPNQKKYDAEMLAGRQAIEAQTRGTVTVWQTPKDAQERYQAAYKESQSKNASFSKTVLDFYTPAQLKARNEWKAAQQNPLAVKTKLQEELDKRLDAKYPMKTRFIEPATTKSMAKYRDIEWWFFKQGGNPDDFNNAVKEGNTKSPRGKDANYMLMKAFKNDLGIKDIGLITRAIVSVYGGDKFGLGDEGTFVVGIGCADVISCTTAVTAYVVPITEGILAISSLLSAVGIDLQEVVTGDKAKAEKEAKDKAEKEAAEAKAAAAEAARLAAEAKKKKEEDDAKTSKTNTTLIVGGVGVALVGAYFLLKK
jgi:hypothetical protein